MSARALRYLVATRLRNRVAGWIARLRTPSGIATLIVLVLVVVGMIVGTDWGRQAAATDLQAVLLTILGFLLVTGILAGIGQRGFVFSAADIDFLFPAPIARRHLLAYQFVPQYIAAGFTACMIVFLAGGRYLPQPALFFVGAFLCQVTTAHLSAAAAELSMLLADSVFRLVRIVITVLVLIVVVAGMFLLVAGLGGWGDVPSHLQAVTSGDLLRVLLYVPRQAIALGAAPDPGTALAALGTLLAWAAGSFVLVLLVPADVVTGSFASSRRHHKRVEQMRRGVAPARVKRSGRAPHSRWFRGAGAVFWLNWMTLRRQLRAMLGGLFVVIIIFVVVGSRGASRTEGALDTTLLALLAMIPLWMPLPIGFRLPREQLIELRGLPLKPVRLAGALILMPVLAPFVLQTVGMTALLAAGRIAPVTAVAALPAFVVASGTLVAIESMFVLRRSHPNAVNLMLSMAQFVLQFLALLPGLVLLGTVLYATRSMPTALLAAALGQSIVTILLLQSLGRQLHERDLETSAA